MTSLLAVTDQRNRKSVTSVLVRLTSFLTDVKKPGITPSLKFYENIAISF